MCEKTAIKGQPCSANARTPDRIPKIKAGRAHDMFVRKVLPLPRCVCIKDNVGPPVMPASWAGPRVRTRHEVNSHSPSGGPNGVAWWAAQPHIYTIAKHGTEYGKLDAQSPHMTNFRLPKLRTNHKDGH